jgi:anti-anti-sigma factor
MQLTWLSDDGEVIRLQCEGDITLTDFRAGQDPLQGLLGMGCFARKVLLSLANTKYIDSSGVGWLVVHHKRFVQAGGKLVLHSIPPRVSQVFQLLRLAQVLHLTENEPTARTLALGEKS